MCTGAELLFGAQAAGAVGGLMQDSNKAFGKAKQAGQILANAKADQQQASISQGRRAAFTRAAYAASGVKQTGTPLIFQEQQARQDEEELLRIRYNANVEAKDLVKAAKAGQKAAFANFIKDAGMTASYGFSSGLLE